ncbi:hypothetical protein AAAX09_09270, partial [Bifidobacterium longum]|uniref:hypothetical protein n=1 Tax=Bifidobacterium longum TaxID=216816 RepID=UPI0032C190EC
ENRTQDTGHVSISGPQPICAKSRALSRAAVFDVTLHYKHRDALAVAREHKRLIWFLKADLPAMNVQGKDHCLICNFISALDGNSSVVLTDNPSVEFMQIHQ